MTRQGALLRKNDECVVVLEGERLLLKVPIHHLEGVVVFGRVMVTPAVIDFLAKAGVALAFMSRAGRFVARMTGPQSGNVLLRLDQYRAGEDEKRSLRIARMIVRGKIANARSSVLRSKRDREEPTSLEATARHLKALMRRLGRARTHDEVRGIEGEAARAYYGAFDEMILVEEEAFVWRGRSRRPPRDPLNALLSFLYALNRNDCAAALEGVGLDPQLGFLHEARPGRPSLALDLQEELRPILADRLALTLLNRKQLGLSDFKDRPGGAWALTEAGRRTTLVSYQRRKDTEVQHPLLGRRSRWDSSPTFRHGSWRDTSAGI